MSRLVKIILLFLVLVGAAFSLYRMGIFKKSAENPASLKQVAPAQPPREETWLNSAENYKQSFAYPATEVEFSVNFTQNAKRQRDQIRIADIDEETLFCLKELLKQENIHFTYRKMSKHLDIVLYLQGGQEQKILRLLDYYAIKYHKN